MERGQTVKKIHWHILSELAQAMKSQSIHQLFMEDPERTTKLTCQFDCLYYDFSKQKLNNAVYEALIDLANESSLSEQIDRLLQGYPVNDTEGRPALHTALRMPQGTSIFVDGKNVVPEVHESLNKMASIVARLHQRYWRGFSGRVITDVVNIGVGGSDLGPFMATNALAEFAAPESRHLTLHFVSSMDGTQIHRLLDKLDPETTLFIVSSKSFTTVDTFYNANTAIAWMMAACPSREKILKSHFIGVSANVKKMTEWGIVSQNQLVFWDWVGGRFSMWSAIGLPIAIRIGMHNFRQLLAGAHAMDKHFGQAPMDKNLPVILGLIGVWNATFLNISGHAVLPYDGRLKYLPNYLTQLEMESNGKSVSKNGQKLTYQSCPILWGEVGSNAQHAFYQLLHQGTRGVSSDFIAPVARYDDEQCGDESRCSLIEQHKLSLANCLAQARVLAFGNLAVNQPKSIQPSFKNYRGNQPSSLILLDKLTPYSLGQLIALYEHKVYVMSVIWQINPFDQWGVELGKEIAKSTLNALGASSNCEEYDPSTNAAINFINQKLNPNSE